MDVSPFVAFIGGFTVATLFFTIVIGSLLLVGKGDRDGRSKEEGYYKND